MKNLLPSILLLLLLFLIRGSDAIAQPVNDSVLLNSPLYREKLHLFTDRSLYASGEPVHFRLFNLSNTLLKEGNWSKVVYLELISSGNIPVARGKYRLESGGASGQMMIPDTVTTGQYYLRAYTKWMRNFPPSAYDYLPLAVVNAGKIRISDLSARTAGPAVNDGTGPRVGGIVCSSNKPSYGKREKVILALSRESNLASPDGYCISVIQKGTLDEGYNYIPGPGEQERVMKELLYLPETRGISVTGSVVQGRGPVVQSGMNMTLLGSDQDYFGFATDGKGRIFFSIPRHAGNTDALIVPDVKGGESIQILMDEEFSTDYSILPGQHVDFFRDRRDLVEQILMQSQLRKAFLSAAGDSLVGGTGSSGYVFYGTPEFRYRTDDYVALPNMEEFLFELIPQVQVIKYRDKRYIEVMDDYGVISNYPPLILLDHVPLTDVESFLQVSPRQIDYIDIIHRVYFRGSNTYGGIVSIISREGDRAGIALPAGSTFVSFRTFNDLAETHFPVYDPDATGDRIPDLRTTLYWAAQEDIAAGKEQHISFYTSDLSGDYMVIVRGVTPEGAILKGICEFTVK